MANWGNIGGGAAGGAAIGSMFGSWGTALGALGGGLMGAFGDQGEEAKPGGYMWLQNPQYSWTEPNLRLAGDWASGALQNIQEGQIPWYIQALGGNLRKSQYQRQMPQQVSYDVARGLGRGGAAGRNYFDRALQIEDAINNIMFGGTQQALGQAMNVIHNPYQQGPQGQWGSYGATPAQPGWGEQIGQAGMGMLPYMNQPQGGTNASGFDPYGVNLDWSSVGMTGPAGGYTGTDMSSLYNMSRNMQQSGQVQTTPLAGASPFSGANINDYWSNLYGGGGGGRGLGMW